MMDLTEDDVAKMIQDSKDMVNASTVSAADFKAAHWIQPFKLLDN
jgi:hypothetical protein